MKPDSAAMISLVKKSLNRVSVYEVRFQHKDGAQVMTFSVSIAGPQSLENKELVTKQAKSNLKVPTDWKVSSVNVWRLHGVRA